MLRIATVMTEERILTAVERIDAAMTRIEATATRLPAPPIALAAAANDDLRERHDTMRSQVEAAIAELDTMIRNG